MTDTDQNPSGRPAEAAAYIEALTGELARIAATHRLHMLQYLLDMAREEAASIARSEPAKATGER